MRITKSWGTNEYSFLYKKSVTGKEKSQWKLESFLENMTTFKVLMRSFINFISFFNLFFSEKSCCAWRPTDQFKLLCQYHVFNRLHPTPALTSGGKKGKSNLKYNRTEKDLSVLLMFFYCSKLCKFCLADSFGRTSFEHNHTTGAYN